MSNLNGLRCTKCGGELNMEVGFDGMDQESVAGEGSGFTWTVQLLCNSCGRTYDICRCKGASSVSEIREKEQSYCKTSVMTTDNIEERTKNIEQYVCTYISQRKLSRKEKEYCREWAERNIPLQEIQKAIEIKSAASSDGILKSTTESGDYMSKDNFSLESVEDYLNDKYGYEV